MRRHGQRLLLLQESYSTASYCSEALEGIKSRFSCRDPDVAPGGCCSFTSGIEPGDEVKSGRVLACKDREGEENYAMRGKRFLRGRPPF